MEDARWPLFSTVLVMLCCDYWYWKEARKVPVSQMMRCRFISSIVLSLVKSRGIINGQEINVVLCFVTYIVTFVLVQTPCSQ